MFRTIQEKDNYTFGQYENGMYAVNYVTKAVGMTLICTEDAAKALEVFNNLLRYAS